MKKCLALFAALAVLSSLALAEDTAATAAAPAPAPAAPAEAPAEPPQEPVIKNGLAPAMHPGPQVRDPQAMEKRMTEALQQTATQLLQLYDANKDGKLDDAEKAVMDKELAIAAKLQRFVRINSLLQKVDVNHDLVISPEEAANIKTALQQWRQENRPDFQRNGGPHPGQQMRPPMPPQEQGQQPGGENPPPMPPPDAPASAQ